MAPSFAGPAGNPAQARGLIRAALDGQRPELVATAELLTSEVVSNALDHAAGARQLIIDVGRDRLRVEVLDTDPRTDLAPHHADPSSERGRGLFILDTLAAAWGVEPQADGKTVWFELPLWVPK